MSDAGGGKVEEGGAEEAKTGSHTWRGDWEGIDPTQPCEAAKSLARFQIVEKVPTEFPKTGTPGGHIRIVCISDTHSLHSESNMTSLPPGDVIVHAGDFSNTGTEEEVKAFAAWFTALPYKHRIVIAGNHDTIMHDEYYKHRGARMMGHRRVGSSEACRAAFAGCTYLEDSGCEVEGLKFWGSPWQPEFCDWAFNLARGQECQEKWDKIPTDTDVLITHGPPLLHGDTCSTGFRAGCANLLYEIQQRIKPKLHVFGHIHEGWGITTDGVTSYVNASTCTSRYKPTHHPIIMDVPCPAATKESK